MKSKRKFVLLSSLGVLLFLTSCDDDTNYYKITWQNYDGQILEIDEQVEKGTMPSYDSAIPTKATDENRYRFAGWDKEIDVATEDIIYTATYEIEAERKTVRWYDDQDNLLKEAYFFDDEPVYDMPFPTKEGYNFDKFSFVDSNEKNVIKYVATFTKKEKYIVKFIVDGKVVHIESLEKGITSAYLKEKPTKESDDNYDYQFCSWEIDFPENSLVTYTAKFSKTSRLYDVSWLNDDNTVLATTKRKFKELVRYSSQKPTKESDAKFKYTFDKWVLKGEDEGKDITYMASYLVTPQYSNVRFINDDGEVLREVGYRVVDTFDLESKSKGLSPNKAKTKDTYYMFSGWSKEENVVEDGLTYEIYKALFDEYQIVNDGNFIFIENSDRSSYRLDSVINTSLTEVEIPNNVNGVPVTIIDTNAFSKVSASLKKVTLPNSLTEIKPNAFSNCNKLFEVYNLSNLDIKLDSNLDLFGKINNVALAIHHSKDEPSIYTKDENGFVFAYVDGKGYLVNYETDDYYPYSITLPSSFTYNGTLIDEYEIYYAFSNDIFQKLTIPSANITIGSHAFTYCSFDNFSMQNSSNVIGDYAFSGCRFNTIDIPNTITEIGDYAFKSVIVSSLTIPDSVLSIGDYAFFCATLDNLIIGSNVNSIGEHAFASIDGLLEVYNLSSVDIKEEKYGLNVAYVHNQIEPSIVVKTDQGFVFVYVDEVGYLYEYKPSTTVEDVVLPDSFEINGKTINSYKINRKAFEGKSLKTVTIPNSVTEIGALAFDGCRSLTSVTMTNSVLKLGASAFYDCRSLTSVTLSEGVTEIPSNSFYNCNKLKSINLSNIKIIGASAFGGTNLESIALGEEIEEIRRDAFRDCPLTSVRIPGSLKKFSEAFGRLESLYYDGTIDMWAAIDFNNHNPGLYNISNFYFLDSNGDVTLDGKTYSKLGEELVFNEAKVINAYAFSSLSYIKSVKFVQVEYIGRQAFYNDSITSITLPNTIRFIGESAFDGKYSVGNVYFGGDLSDWLKIDFGGVGSLFVDGRGIYFMDENSEYKIVEEVVIPSGVEVIKNYQFAYFSDLKKVVLPDTVKEIGEFAFYSCRSLEDIQLPNNLEIMDGAVFWDCSSIETIVIPDTVTTFGVLMFAGCVNLTTVTLSNGLTEIPRSTFAHCKNLKNVELPASITKIGEDAFAWSGITEIVIPDAVTTIDQRAFGFCKDLESVKLPNNVENVSKWAFTHCDSLKRFEFSNNIKTFKDDAFMDTYIEEVYYHGTKEEFDSIKFTTYFSNPAWFNAKIYVLDSNGIFVLYE